MHELRHTAGLREEDVLKPIHALTMAFALSLAAAASAGVLVVDGQSGPYFDIATAVAAAADGDIVLVKSGLYGGFTITGKGVAVFADASATVHVYGQVRVVDVSAGKTVVLSKLEITPPNEGLEHAALLAMNVQGRLRIQACNVVGPDGAGLLPMMCILAGNPWGWDAVQLIACADVAVSFTSLHGGISSQASIECYYYSSSGEEGGDALEATASVVTLHESDLFGGEGGGGECYGGNGGDGVRLNSSSLLFASNIDAFGGHGGPGLENYICSKGGSGGFGLNVVDGTSLAYKLACSFQGGAAGFGTPYMGIPNCGSPSDCGDGSFGAAEGGMGTVVTLSGSAKVCSVTKVLRENQTAVLQFVGNKGESAFLLVSLSAGATYALGLGGVLLLGDPLIGPFFVGTVPSGGLLSISLLVPDLPAGVQGIVLHLQGALDPPLGPPALTNGAVVALLDVAF
jgi:hypothetical protein